ncbi:uncharacterized protein LOC142748680 isoform X1 [Rhinoderma darwinii]|uniref:uncharacterized protein LOC142748680 isoform X1 n=1 Tax=Rhinoderma darwinii TaxID=43563 RepID=UPI003F6719F0
MTYWLTSLSRFILHISLQNKPPQHRQENPQCSPSLPGQMPPTSLDKQPGPSQRFNQIQPEHEMAQRSPSQQNHAFRSLPPFTQDPPAPPRTHNVSEPIHMDRKTLEDDVPNTPIPETTPYETAPSVGEVGTLKKITVRDESSISADPLPSRDLSPSFKESQPEVSIKSSSEEAPGIQTTVSYHPTASSEEGADNSRGQHERDKTVKLPEQHPAYMTVTSGQEDQGGDEQQREPSAVHKAAKLPEPPLPTSNTRSVTENIGAGAQHKGQPGYPAVANVPDRRPPSPVNRENAQEEQRREQPVNQRVGNVGDRRPPSYSPVNRENSQEEQRREQPVNQRVLAGSSCRPLDNYNDSEVYPSKPGVLQSTHEISDVTGEVGASSEMSCTPILEISDFTERNESTNVSDRSSTSQRSKSIPRSIPRDKVSLPSTPNNRSIQLKDRSPQENDFTFDRGNDSEPSKSSPGRYRPLDQSSSQQPEEDSFSGSDVSQYRLQFNERPGVDLMDNNDDVLRNRTSNIPNTSNPNDQRTEKKTSKLAKEKDYERTVLITIAAASLCLSLYLLWKSRHN